MLMLGCYTVIWWLQVRQKDYHHGNNHTKSWLQANSISAVVYKCIIIIHCGIEFRTRSIQLLSSSWLFGSVAKICLTVGITHQSVVDNACTGGEVGLWIDVIKPLVKKLLVWKICAVPLVIIYASWKTIVNKYYTEFWTKETCWVFMNVKNLRLSNTL